MEKYGSVWSSPDPNRSRGREPLGFLSEFCVARHLETYFPISERSGLDFLMKVLSIILVALTLPFLILSVVYGIESGDLRSGSWGLGDAAYQAARQQQQKLHLIVMAFSIPYFLLALGTFITSAIQSRSKGWRSVGFLAAFVALAMTGWSLLLSGAISFDETFPAWLVAGVLFGILGIVSLTQSQGHPAEHPRPQPPERRRR